MKALMMAALLAAGLAQAAPATYRNPVLPGFHPDPSICKVGQDFYLATSSFEYFPGVPIFHSRDLVNWRQVGHALTRASQLPLAGQRSSRGIYAPTLRCNADGFYLVTTNIDNGGNFYVHAKDPAGEWSEPVWLKEPAPWMDPSLLFDDDGQVYYTRHDGGERGGIVQARIDLKDGKLLEVPRRIWNGTGGVWPEGPHLYKIDGMYYLMVAEGGRSNPTPAPPCCRTATSRTCRCRPPATATWYSWTTATGGWSCWASGRRAGATTTWAARHCWRPSRGGTAGRKSTAASRWR